MNERKRPTVVMHFTHVEHLSTVVEHGLVSDTLAQSSGLLTTEVGNREIKDRRRRREVPIGPRGVVADYVPFYFRAPSPMMSAIAKGQVEEYRGGTRRLVYVVTTLDRLVADGLEPLITDRNASLEFAEYRRFEVDDSLDDGFIAWEVMRARYWNDYPAGRERRMAECLVHRCVPWGSVRGVVTHNDQIAEEVEDVLRASGSRVDVRVRPDWYL